MNYPNPGWQQQPPPGYGYGYPPPRRPSTAPAYLVAVVFLVASLWALVTGILAANGELVVELMSSLVGLPFTEDVTGNLDFAISATITVGCVGLLCTVLLFARLGFARWLLAFVGVVVVVNYAISLVKVIEFGHFGPLVLVVLGVMLVWLFAVLLVLLPFTGHAMRGYQRRFSEPGTPVHGPGTAGHYPRG